LKPDYPAALFNLGVALHLLQQFDQAISAYRRAIALRPNYVEAHCNLGNALGCNGQVDEAVATLRRVIALRQSIAESGNPGSSSQGVDLARRVIIPPYLGEFGYKLLNHVRFVHELEADAKLVCCRRGEELLYPSATGFEYDWEDKVPDVERVSDGPQGKAPHRTGYTVVNPKYTYPIPWKTFRPVATAMLPTVDVAIGARNRGHDTERNWRHWAWLASKLRELDFTVGLVGHPETSQNFDVDVRPWEHPAGHTSGSVDLLSHCRVYVGTDTGTTHLAAFCDTPTVGFCRRGKFPELMFYAQAMNQSVFTRLPEAAWDDPKAVLDAVTASVSH
jgi:hypothetical protein